MSAPIAIVGPGGVGGTIAVQLIRAGDGPAPVLVARDGTRTLLDEKGLTLHSGLYGDATVPVTTAAAIPEGAQVVLAIKAYGLEDTIPRLQASRPAGVLSLLNGIEHVDLLRSALPGVEVTGAAIRVEVTRGTDASVLEHLSPYCSIDVADDAIRRELPARLAAAGMAVRPHGTEKHVLWDKLRLLSVLALLTSRYDCGIAEAVAADEAGFRALVGEVCAVADADGDPSDPEALEATVCSLAPGFMSSMSRDRRRGNPTEIDAIGGAIVRAGSRLGVTTPVLDALVDRLT